MIPWFLSLAKLRKVANNGSSQRVNNIHQDKDPAEKTTKQVGDYTMLHTIGKGSTGIVKLGVHKESGRHVAIKVIPRRHLLSSATASRSVEKELAILHLVQHPNIIDLIHVFQDPINIYFVTDYVDGGNLYEILTIQTRFSELDAKHLFGQLANALAWCHAHHICHRDLKLENILYDSKTKKIKVADFGMATIQSVDTLLRTSCGSPNYVSPEIVAGKPYYGPAADVWSSGVILFTMLAGYFPFDDLHLPSLLLKIKYGRRRRIPAYLSRGAKDLILCMLTPDPARRISMVQVLQHPWIKSSRHKTRFPLEQTITDDATANSMLDNVQEGPVIENVREMDGRIWETLKVLWRDCDQETLVGLLTTVSPTVQKTTFRLLNERFRKEATERNGKVLT